jgi:hypothetical protein
MNNNLVLTFSPEEDPFEEDIGRGLVWGRINLNVVDRNGEIVQRVIDMVWDVKELVEWILTNESFLYTEEYPKEYIAGGNSLAEFRYKYYDQRPEDDIDYLADEILYQYATRHSIYYGMSGTKTIQAFIGKRNAGYEISYYPDEARSWRYDIDLAEFINGVKKIREVFLKTNESNPH